MALRVVCSDDGHVVPLKLRSECRPSFVTNFREAVTRATPYGPGCVLAMVLSGTRTLAIQR
jgi:hypothetical protein